MPITEAREMSSLLYGGALSVEASSAASGFAVREKSGTTPAFARTALPEAR